MRSCWTPRLEWLPFGFDIFLLDRKPSGRRGGGHKVHGMALHGRQPENPRWCKSFLVPWTRGRMWEVMVSSRSNKGAT